MAKSGQTYYTENVQLHQNFLDPSSPPGLLRGGPDLLQRPTCFFSGREYTRSWFDKPQCFLSLISNIFACGINFPKHKRLKARIGRIKIVIGCFSMVQFRTRVYPFKINKIDTQGENFRPACFRGAHFRSKF